MKAVMQTLLILMLAALALTGCGQKGDLFLPATKPQVATPAQPATDAPLTTPETQQPAPNQSGPTPAGQSLPDAAVTGSDDGSQQAQPNTSNTKR